MEEKNKEIIKILDIPINPVNFFEALKTIEDLIGDGKKHQVATVNPEFIIHSLKDKEFKKALLESSLNTADGIGIIWAAKFLKLRKISNFKFKILNFGKLFISLAAIIFNRKWLSSEIPERVTGVDLMWELANQAQERGWKIFLLGGSEGVAIEVAEKLKTLYPRIQIVGAYAGSPKEEGVAERIAKTKPDILFVAFGSPKQEKFIHQNLDKLGSKVVIGVGGSFDFIVGKAKRAPKIFQKLGIEWVWRLLRQPKRIGRIFNAFPYFVWKVWKSRYLL
uniref:Glycosyltransferase n=1 Tax=candidate division CPR3 bacterium TaxID=2268181 RepID=A0A7C4R7T8_UNCC3